MGVYVGDNLVAGNVGEVYSKAQVDAMIANAVALAEPTGSIKPFAGTTVPDGYLLCDGSAVSRTTYAALFAVIGTTYGTGDGSTTFNLPDYFDKTFWCNPEQIGVSSKGEIPNIYGSFETGIYSSGATDAFQNYTTSGHYEAGVYRSAQTDGKVFYASNCSSVYVNNIDRVMPSVIATQFLIKY